MMPKEPLTVFVVTAHMPPGMAIVDGVFFTREQAEREIARIDARNKRLGIVSLVRDIAEHRVR